MALLQHELVVDGDIMQALDMCRRLLRTENSYQRIETAHLVLERLRSNSTNDSVDDVNALLRLLSIYVAPTRELTEEMLSLLIFCDHRVLLIHHLPKLTYQSKECVQLVVQSYMELLATDRSLLVPVLGSLSEMPLDISEKNTVVEATEALLDAVVEEDIPSVVQNLLSIVTKKSAPKALARLRMECNRIQSGTLSLTMEVIGRYATTGSVVLAALLRLIRLVDPLTRFDVVFLTFVMGKVAENELAVRSTTLIAQSGRLNGRIMREVVTLLVRPEWASFLPSLVRFCSCLLAVSFRERTQAALASNLIASSVDSLIALIEFGTSVQAEALILLLTIVSQPKKLLLLSKAKAGQLTRSVLCWSVAEVIAVRFLELAKRNVSALASSSHLFLDHLHGIASTSNESEIDEKYPSYILELLCSTMALLTKNERGIYSLLMITIQKQLVSRVGVFHNPYAQQACRQRSRHTRASAVEIKQLMAVFLTGHLLKHQAVVECRDRNSLADWMLRLVTSTNQDETLLHVLRFVRDELNRTREVSASQSERTVLASAIFKVFQKKGLCWTPRDQMNKRLMKDSDCIIAFDNMYTTTNADEEEFTNPLVVDATEFVQKMQFGTPLPSFNINDAQELETIKRLTEEEYLMKICLLQELFYCYLEFALPAEKPRIVDAAFALPSIYKAGLNAQTSESVEPFVLNNVIWNLVCGLDIAVTSTNFIAEQCNATIASLKPKHDSVLQLSRMAARLHVCLEQREILELTLAAQKRNLQKHLNMLDDTSSSRHSPTRKNELEWLLLEVTIVEQLLKGQLCRVQGELPRASLFGLDFHVMCMYFGRQYKEIFNPPVPEAYELELLHVFNRHLQSDGVAPLGSNDCNISSETIGKNLRFLTSRREGRRTLKWLCYRSMELCHAISSEEFDESESDKNDDFKIASGERASKILMAYRLSCIYDSYIVILEACRIATAAGDSTWSHTIMELLAKGSNDDTIYCENPQGWNEIFFRFLARQCLELTDPTLACRVIDVIISLVVNTRKSPLISQLCLALLHQIFPSHPTPSKYESDTRNYYNDIPSRPLPNAVVLPSNGRMSALAKHRCSLLKYRHIAYLVVGSWAYSTTASTGSTLLTHYVNEIRNLIDAAVPQQNSEGHKMCLASVAPSDEESDKDDMEDKRNENELAVIANGEHIVLKSLTNESMPYFLEAVLLCALASLHRAVPKKTNAPGLTNSNPFLDSCRAMHVVQNAVNVFAHAEICGFNLPLRTNVVVLRKATFATRTAQSIIIKCIAWRVEQSVTDKFGALTHLSILFGAANAMKATMETLLSVFQERVLLKMQLNVNSRRKRGWANPLLAKTYGKKFITRQCISKAEAKLLPFLSHAVQELHDFLQNQSTVNNINLKVAKADWKCAASVWSEYKHHEVMLSDVKLVAACRSLQEEELTTTLLKDWRTALPFDTDDIASDLDDDEEVDELNEESLSEDEDDGFAVKSYASSIREKSAAGLELNESEQRVIKLHDNEDLGFPTIVVNYKKQKTTRSCCIFPANSTSLT
ncbi:hypothetical protein CCR75_006669 [Bremia lactucae]|uniref:Uncharacterized protein n=1 Tax=Bremia lactucae TaxID=4779 RepID=A0A976NZ52_BRELC|nr:hypothetical protein CCR75_006669 [Bremia lactucae]